ncbi:MAG TPA: hypothetical protein VM597_30565 [Gemmataceae bacterium]|nr:hypothetical protein [Gemmataceae bacterium]
MTNSEWIEMLQLVPEAEHSKLVIVLQTGAELCVDTLVKFDRSFLVLRGRLGGTIEEARAFFVPYSQMLCLRLERVIKVDELQEMLPTGPGRYPTPVNRLTDATREEMPFQSAHPTPVAAPTDPAAASRLLLEKIRATRAAAAPAPRSVGPR